MKYRVLAILIGYCFGLIQTAYIYGKTQGIDIRNEGSGNAGTTNALRTMGKKAGAIVLAGDLLKSIFAILFVSLLFGNAHPELKVLLKMYTGLGCVLGHNYPFYMKFKGGKGVACTVGMIMASSLPLFLIEVVLFFGTIALTHYVSLGSLLCGLCFLIGTVVSGQMGLWGTTDPKILMEIYVVVGIVVVEMYIRHRANIARLIKGEERRTYLLKKNN